MTNNDIIKRLRFVLGIDTNALADCFKLGGIEVSSSQVDDFFSREGEEARQACTEEQLAVFLDGLIVYRRGPGKPNRNRVALTNNVILKKIRIAFELQAQELDGIFMLTDYEFSPHEISAFFRKPGTVHYKECSDEVLEAFFNGMSLFFR